MTTAREKLTKARAGLVLDMPFFASLALRLTLTEDTSTETAYTDGRVLGYNPAFIDGLPLDRVKGLVCHEVMHVAAAHITRRGGRDSKRWNQAADYAINGILRDAGATLPDGCLLDSRFDGLSADAIYSQLPEPRPDDNGQGQGPEGFGEVRDCPGDTGPATETELAAIEQDIKIAVASASEQARKMGKLPAGLARIADDMLAPRLDWREILRRFVDQMAKSDYSWSPPNRRYIHQGLYLPSLRSEQLPPIAVAVDTSGSISDNDLKIFAAELGAILAEYNTVLHVIYCDRVIKATEEFTADDLPLKLNAVGGGGTDFRPPFEWIAEHGIAPTCLIYLTDLLGPFPDSAPDYPVLWVQHGGYGYKPPFGDTVDLV